MTALHQQIPRPVVQGIDRCPNSGKATAADPQPRPLPQRVIGNYRMVVPLGNDPPRARLKRPHDVVLRISVTAVVKTWKSPRRLPGLPEWRTQRFGSSPEGVRNTWCMPRSPEAPVSNSCSQRAASAPNSLMLPAGRLVFQRAAEEESFLFWRAQHLLKDALVKPNVPAGPLPISTSNRFCPS